MVKKRKTKKKALADPKYINVPNICFSLTKVDDKREKKYTKQRMTRGFDDSETWSLRDTMTNFILPRLLHYRKLMKTMIGDSDDFYASLDKSIRAFEIVKESTSAVSLSDEVWEEYHAGMEAFGKIYMRLWW